MRHRTTRQIVSLTVAVAFLLLASSTAWAVIAWTAKAAMPTARSGLAGAVGKDGTIYAIGGRTTSDLNTVEAYVPSTNKWTAKKPMPTARQGLAAATGKDGKVYAIGGQHAGVRLTTVEAYDPVHDIWAAKKSMPTARTDLAAVTGSDGKIYAIGGWSKVNAFNDPTALTTLEVYDPVANSWATKSPMPTARYWLAAAAGTDGKLYAIGGEATNTTSLQSVEAYNPTTNTWTKVASMPNTTQGNLSITGRNGLAAAVGSGKIFAIGGTEEDFISLSTVQSYKLMTGKWSSEVSMPTAREYLAAVASLGKIYAIGGFNGSSTKPLACRPSGNCHSVEVFTPN